MRIFLTKVLFKLGAIFNKYSNKINPNVIPHDPAQGTRVKEWYRVDGDSELRLNYDLNKESVVFDFGGFKGDFAADIFCRYKSTIYVFEPVPKYAKGIEKRFNGNKDVKIFPFGLAEKDENLILNLTGDASSHVQDKKRLGTETINAQLKNAEAFLIEHKIEQIDLMKINIEGAEYDLLENFARLNWFSKIKNLQIQFHDFFPEAKARMNALQKELSKTHKTTYSYEFVWENWERID